MDADCKLALSVRQLAAALEVSTRHVERLDAAGRIPRPVRIGKSKRWVVSEITAWLAAGCPNWSDREDANHAT